LGDTRSPPKVLDPFADVILVTTAEGLSGYPPVTVRFWVTVVDVSPVSSVPDSQLRGVNDPPKSEWLILILEPLGAVVVTVEVLHVADRVPVCIED
jgi:hypothetical protein